MVSHRGHGNAQEKKRKGTEAIFEVTIAENFPKFMKLRE